MGNISELGFGPVRTIRVRDNSRLGLGTFPGKGWGAFLIEVRDSSRLGQVPNYGQFHFMVEVSSRLRCQKRF